MPGNRLPDFRFDTEAQFCFIFNIVLLCRMHYWLLMELAEKMLATLPDRVMGPDLHLLKPLEAGLKGGRCGDIPPL